MFSKKILSLVLVRRDEFILLGLKKRGFGAGKWNGFGGKKKEEETIDDCAKRELFEECNLVSNVLLKIGFLTFEFVGDPEILEVHVFSTEDYQGEPQESDEMKPKWYHVEDIPYTHMWADDKFWFPLYLKGAKFEGYFKFHGHENIINYDLKEVSVLQIKS